MNAKVLESGKAIKTLPPVHRRNRNSCYSLLAGASIKSESSVVSRFMRFGRSPDQAEREKFIKSGKQLGKMVKGFSLKVALSIDHTLVDRHSIGSLFCN